MAIEVDIAEAENRLSELVAAAVRGEEVILSMAGVPLARLVPVAQKTEGKREAVVARRLATLGVWKGRTGTDNVTVPPSMTDEAMEERWQRKFGPSA